MVSECRFVSGLRCWRHMSDRLVSGLLLLVSAGLLVAVYVMQYGFGMRPCDMCLLQRYPVYGALGLGLIGVLFAGRRWAAKPLHGLAALAYLVAGGLAIHHVGIEQGWWESMTGCASQFGQAQSLQEMYEMMMAAPAVRCDDVQFRLLGLSLAAWNIPTSFGLAMLLLLSLTRVPEAK